MKTVRTTRHPLPLWTERGKTGWIREILQPVTWRCDSRLR